MFDVFMSIIFWLLTYGQRVIVLNSLISLIFAEVLIFLRPQFARNFADIDLIASNISVFISITVLYS